MPYHSDVLKPGRYKMRKTQLGEALECAALIEDVHRMVNQHRAAQGLPPHDFAQASRKLRTRPDNRRRAEGKAQARRAGAGE